MKPGARLRAYRKGKQLSIRAAATEIDVSHVAFRAWERGSTPAMAYRALIAAWTHGEVPADAWEPSRAERAVAKSMEKLATTDPVAKVA